MNNLEKVGGKVGVMGRGESLEVLETEPLQCSDYQFKHPQEEKALVLEVVMSVEPIFQGEVGEDVAGLRYENLPHGLHDARVGHVVARLR